VAQLCRELQVPHHILTASWECKPETAIQENARKARYRLLGEWANRSDLGALVTAHHIEDQAETLVMRLGRGVGVRGLAGMRSAAPVPGYPGLTLLRPLLAWQRSELDRVCADAGVFPVADPSNLDPAFERVRVREALARCELLEAEPLARSARSLAEADAAIDWAAKQAWDAAVDAEPGAITIKPAGLPAEILRRLIGRTLNELATEGRPDLRGREVDQLLETLGTGGRSTLRGVLCTGGSQWRFIPAPNRTRRNADPR
jgi:tRNA(Ile)-lysidine synthase